MFDAEEFKTQVRDRQKHNDERYSTARMHCIRSLLARVLGEPPQVHQAERQKRQGWRIREFNPPGDLWIDEDGLFTVHVRFPPGQSEVRGRSAAETLAALAAIPLTDDGRNAFRGALEDVEDRIRCALQGKPRPTPEQEFNAYLDSMHETTEYNSEGPWKVRPFDGTQLPHSPIPIAGFIRDRSFVVRARGVEVAVDTADVGTDKDGAFALLREGVYALPDGFDLRLTAEDDYGIGTSLVIEVRREQPEAVALRKNMPHANLILPPLDSWAVHVASWGKIDAWSGTERPGR